MNNYRSHVSALLLFCVSAHVCAETTTTQVLRDPTRPLGALAHTTHRHGLTLQAIISRQGQHMAIVNDQQVKKGDRLGDSVIIAITDKYIVANEQGKQLTYFLHEDISNAK